MRQLEAQIEALQLTRRKLGLSRKDLVALLTGESDPCEVENVLRLAGNTFSVGTGVGWLKRDQVRLENRSPYEAIRDGDAVAVHAIVLALAEGVFE